jgi:hypothetical protein
MRWPLNEAIVDLVVGLRHSFDRRNDLIIEQCRQEVFGGLLERDAHEIIDSEHAL